MNKLKKLESAIAKLKVEVKKFDDGKIMVDLLVPEFLEGIARVMTMGAKKYGSENWKKGISEESFRRRILAALYRHLLAYHKGEIYDKESGENHLLHITCNAMFLYFDDEVKGDAKEAPS